MESAKIAIGPMSPLVVEGIHNFTLQNKIPIMIIASRNQVDWNGGYVNNWTTENFSKTLKKYNNKYLIPCRDHCGPFFSPKDKNLKLYKAVDNVKKTIETDIFFDFKIIHIDTSFCGKDKFDVMKELVDHCKKVSKLYSKHIEIEIGSDENDGTPLSPRKFENYIKKILKFCSPKFVVAQTGSLVKEIYQVGQFNFINVSKICQIAKNYSIYLKEHNCDYLNEVEINLRRISGVDAINVAPEFGVIQTKLTYYKGLELGLNKEINNYKKKVISSDKWHKWKYGNILNELKFLTAGHYFFTSNEYNELFFKIQKTFDIKNFIKNSLINRIKVYKDHLL